MSLPDRLTAEHPDDWWRIDLPLSELARAPRPLVDTLEACAILANTGPGNVRVSTIDHLEVLRLDGHGEFPTWVLSVFALDRDALADVATGPGAALAAGPRALEAGE